MRKTTQKLTIDLPIEWIKIILIVLGISIVCVIIFYFQYVAIKGDYEDRQRYVDAEKLVGLVKSRFQSQEKHHVEWQQYSGCSYTYGTGLKPGGWYCVTQIATRLDVTQASYNEVGRLDMKLRNSADILSYQTTSSQNNFPKQVGGGGRLVSMYTTKKDSVFCEYNSTLLDRDEAPDEERRLAIGFRCSGGARQSWYPNHETDASIPGKDAWKRLGE